MQFLKSFMTMKQEIIKEDCLFENNNVPVQHIDGCQEDYDKVVEQIINMLETE